MNRCMISNFIRTHLLLTLILYPYKLCAMRAYSVRCPKLKRFVPLRSFSEMAEPSHFPNSAHAQLQPQHVYTKDPGNPYLIDKSEFKSQLKGKLVLAPLTRGGNLPFRRLCADFGADFTMSEMAYARFLYKGRSHNLVRKERALMRKSASEKYYGFQIATNSADEILKALDLCYHTQSVTWLDLNYGCPTYEASKRGLGAIQLKHPKKIDKLLNIIMPQIQMPLTVKVRLGIDDTKINVQEILSVLSSNKVAAVTIHGRTMEQRYSKPADWNIINEMAVMYPDLPIIGNGDILTWYEANDRLYPHANLAHGGNSGNLTAVMTGRGALIKPWIFKEFLEQKEFEPSTEERVHIYYKLGTYFKEHFGNDEIGKKSAFNFFPWHFDFLCRYRPLPKSIFYDLSKKVPLIQNSRLIDDKLREYGFVSNSTFTDTSLIENLGDYKLDTDLERLLSCESTDSHLAIANELWDSQSPEDAMVRLQKLAVEKLSMFQQSNGDRSNSRRAEAMWSA